MFAIFRKLLLQASARMLTLFLSAGFCLATIVPPVSFHDLIAKSNQILTGRVIGSKTAWGAEHKYIWTRYEIAVDNIIKGERQKTVIVSEPGGTLEGITMRIAGAVAYAPGERVALFLEIYPSGNKRTVAWGQGKISFDAAGKALPSANSTLNGLTEAALRARIQSEINKTAVGPGSSK